MGSYSHPQWSEVLQGAVWPVHTSSLSVSQFWMPPTIPPDGHGDPTSIFSWQIWFIFKSQPISAELSEVWGQICSFNHCLILTETQTSYKSYFVTYIVIYCFLVQISSQQARLINSKSIDVESECLHKGLRTIYIQTSLIFFKFWLWHRSLLLSFLPWDFLKGTDFLFRDFNFEA